MRMDSTLLDVSEQSLKRGDMSFIFDAKEDDSKWHVLTAANHCRLIETVQMTIVNRVKKTFMAQRVFGGNGDEEVLDEDHDERLEEDITMLMGRYLRRKSGPLSVTDGGCSDIVDVDVNPHDIVFTRAMSGWIGFREERTENVGEYEVAMSLMYVFVHRGLSGESLQHHKLHYDQSDATGASIT